MTIISIGREPGNDIIINDSFVGRKHLELIKDKSGNIILRDLNSTNGTFINGAKVTGEVYLRQNDRVRIGNTEIPWFSYFPAERTEIYSPPTMVAQPQQQINVQPNVQQQPHVTPPPIAPPPKKMKFNLQAIIATVSSILGLGMMIMMLVKGCS